MAPTWQLYKLDLGTWQMVLGCVLLSCWNHINEHLGTSGYSEPERANCGYPGPESANCATAAETPSGETATASGRTAIIQHNYSEGAEQTGVQGKRKLIMDTGKRITRKKERQRNKKKRWKKEKKRVKRKKKK